jgi:3-amino-5-hydroxybenzoate synthase
MSHPLAIEGGRPIRERPFATWPASTPKIEQAVIAVARSGHWWQSGGGASERLETWLAEYCGTTRAVGVSSGSMGLELALCALGVGTGDEVLVPAWTFIASAMSVLRVGAVPVAVDVQPDTFTIDPQDALRKLTPHTRAIMPVHLAGQPADLDALTELAKERGLVVIEDAAQAIGAGWKGRRCGAVGDLGVFSFQAAKLLSAGEGGGVIGGRELLDKLERLANCGRRRGSSSYEHDVIATNARLGEFQAAVALAQVDRLDDLGRQREASLERLRQSLKGSAVKMQSRPPEVTRHGCYMVVLALPRGARRDADWFAAALNAEGLPARPMYPPYYATPAFRGLSCPQAPCCPVTEDLASRTVWLHHAVLLDGDDGDRDVARACWKISCHLNR